MSEQITSRNVPAWVLEQDKQLFKKLNNENLDLFLYHDVLLPVLNLQLEVEELAREEFNFVHKTIIQLIHGRINTIAALAHVMGLAESAINEKLTELYGLGFIEQHDDTVWQLTEIGTKNVFSDNPVRHVNRSLRICASSEQLLPSNAYRSKFIRTTELTEKNLSWVMLAEENQAIDLSHLKSIEFMTVTDKSHHNIPDEVQRIVEINDYEAGFQKTKLLITGDHSKNSNTEPSKAWIQFKDQFLELPLQKVPKLVSTIKWKQEKIFESIKRTLGSHNVDIGESIQQDQYGVIYAKVSSASVAWLSRKDESYLPNLIRCRTRTYSGRPFYRLYDGKRDVLNGHSLVLDISELDYAIISTANAMRELYLLVDEFFSTPYTERSTRDIQTYLKRKLASNERENYLELAQKFQLKEAIDWINGLDRRNRFE